MIPSRSDHSADSPPVRHSVSVRHLVETVLQSGSLSSAGLSSARMVEGSTVHRIVQARRGPEYRKEVPVSGVVHVETLGRQVEISLHGRIDGLFHEDEFPAIEEIKSTRRSTIEAGEEVHWAQALCYGALYLAEHGGDEAIVALTYVHPTTEEEHTLRRRHTAAELGEVLANYASRYAAGLASEVNRGEARDRSVSELSFPFPRVRSGQQQLLETVERHFAGTATPPLFVHAPTGIGKTMAILYPAVRAFAGGGIERIFYLAAKGTGKLAAFDATRRLVSAGAVLTTIVLTAKEKICFHPPEALGPSGECIADRCPFAQGYYDRLPAALAEIEPPASFDADAVQDLARRHRVCPFELSLDVSLVADIVIGDYNYLFDPRVFLRRHFLRPGAYGLLVDEAHNLPDRAREMYSASISKKRILAARRGLTSAAGTPYTLLGRLNRWFLALAKEAEGEAHIRWETPPAELIEMLGELRDALGLLLTDSPENLPPDAVQIYFDSLTVLRVAESFDSRYRCYAEPHSGGDVIVHLFCVDPAVEVAEGLSRCRKAVLFSGSFEPLPYFTRLLSTDPSPPTVRLTSPFPEENRRVIVVGTVDTRYRYRSKSAPLLSQILQTLAIELPGNYLAYFPSYGYMTQVHTEYRLLRPEETVIVQHRGMQDDHRQAFLDALDNQDGEVDNRTTGFAVLGGVFAEGVDLPGRRLDGVLVAGVGLPAVTVQQDLIKEYFESVTDHGFSYAYVYPGMNRVIQAAGRAVRSETDRGIIILAGRRLTQRPYSTIVESVWPDAVTVTTVDELAETLAEFSPHHML